jgi:hypothetical protein
MTVSTLRPGLLVSMHSRVTADPDEHDRAVKARTAARGFVINICAQSAFGLLCPASEEPRLMEAIRQARAFADEFNASAGRTKLTITVLVGRIAADDVEAVRAINGEIRELMERMELGLRNLDVEMIREAANKATKISSLMLAPDIAERAKLAIEVSRRVARQIVKAGETAAIEVDRSALEAVRSARVAFLDMDDPEEQPRTVELDLDTETAAIPMERPTVSLFADMDSE